MIEAISLQKRFGPVHAVRDASFRVEPGEIAAFLGPNGAGKTTCMRILTGYLPATGGRAVVAGHDVAADPRAVRRALGYLPQRVPLYGDMRVREYLDFRARLKGVDRRERTNRIAHVLDRCAIVDMKERLVGNLSGGYQQRVGLADALVGDPDVLILDEPTVGLDPNQTVEVRELIAELKADRTVLLSTHILSEAEAISGRVIIIHQGRVLVEDTPEALRRTMRSDLGIVAEVAGAPDPAVAIRGIEGVAHADATAIPGDDGWMRVDITPTSNRDPREAIGALAQREGWRVRELHREALTLEDIFRRLTGDERDA